MPQVPELLPHHLSSVFLLCPVNLTNEPITLYIYGSTNGSAGKESFCSSGDAKEKKINYSEMKEG